MTTIKENKKPVTVAEMCEYFTLLPRATTRLKGAVSDEVVQSLTWPTLRSLAFASRDPQTTAKDITQSQKVMMYRKYDKLWASIAEATRIYGTRINDIKIEPNIGEDVASFRLRFLEAIVAIK